MVDSARRRMQSISLVTHGTVQTRVTDVTFATERLRTHARTESRVSFVPVLGLILGLIQYNTRRTC